MAQGNYDGRTALHLAAAEGHMEAVVFLLEKCNVPAASKDRWGHTPSDDATQFGHSEIADYIAKYLVSQKASEKKMNREKKRIISENTK